MTLDATQQRFGPTMSLDHQYHSQPPAFSNPWSSSASPPQPPAPNSGMYVPGGQQSSGLSSLMASKPQAVRPSGGNGGPSMPAYGSLPVTSSAGENLRFQRQPECIHANLITHLDMMNMHRLPPTSGPYGDAAYTTSASPVGGQFASSGPPYHDGLAGYAPAPIRQSQFGLVSEAERSSKYGPNIHQQHADERRGFADALDASHGMLAMSQETPRPIYGSRTDRSSVDSYGFPSTHSTSSSISSSGNFSSYYGDSVSDYSTAGSDIESVNSRTLPRPHMMNSQMPPAPQSMMGQFSSKVSSSTQKKHKCKVCDKRFTRPSSLQTHMYSHTGEKRTYILPSATVSFHRRRTVLTRSYSICLRS